MKRLLIASFALALLLPACALAQSAFTGTWKIDFSTAEWSGGEPIIIHLKNGMYRCNCHPPIEVKADGQDHPVTGHDGFNTVAVKVIDDHTVRETDKKDGKTVSTETITVAADGKTATNEFVSYGEHESSAKATAMRVADAEPGSHAVAGSWRMTKVDNASANIGLDTYKVDGDNISYSSATGGTYTAKIGGQAVPFMHNGKQDGTVSVQRMGNNTLRETWFDKKGTKTGTSTMTLAADGNSMTWVDHDLRRGNTMTVVANRQ